MEDKKLFLEIQRHLLEDETPSNYLNQLLKDKKLKNYPFSLLEQLKATKQSPKYHPEGDAWIHTTLVVDQGARIKHLSSNPLVLMWAALLHDIGKPNTTKIRKGRITSYNHDIEGEKLAYDFLRYFQVPEELIEKIVSLVRFHMHILYVVKHLPYERKEEMLKRVDSKEVALLGWCDRMGRTNGNKLEEANNIKKFYEITNSKKYKEFP